MISQFVWDFDGTLFDSYPAMARGFQEFLSSRNHMESEEDILNHLHVSFSTAWKYYQGKYHLPDSDLIILKDYRRKAEIHIQPYPGCAQTLNLLQDNGCHNYLMTHRGESAFSYLRSFNMLSLFTRCITSKDGFPRKPDPAGLNALIAEYDPDRTHWIMIGDRTLDLQAGINAGIHTCLFESGAEADASLADFKVTDFRQILKITGLQ